jgi:NAD(P)-dependent dehydrogenase (short-subunit alcohol dehydrogenase family)
VESTIPAGIGYAAALSLANLDAEIHLVCRNAGMQVTSSQNISLCLLDTFRTHHHIIENNVVADRCATAKNKIVDATGNSKIHCHLCDTSSMESVRAFAKSFSADHPRIDVLVNNAGAMPTERTLTSEGNEQIMATMLGGTLLLTDLLLPALQRAPGGGRVINVSSGGAYSVKGISQDLNYEQIAKYDGTFFYALAKRNQLILSEGNTLLAIIFKSNFES